MDEVETGYRERFKLNNADLIWWGQWKAWWRRGYFQWRKCSRLRKITSLRKRKLRLNFRSFLAIILQILAGWNTPRYVSRCFQRRHRKRWNWKSFQKFPRCLHVLERQTWKKKSSTRDNEFCWNYTVCRNFHGYSWAIVCFTVSAI